MHVTGEGRKVHVTSGQHKGRGGGGLRGRRGGAEGDVWGGEVRGHHQANLHWSFRPA